MAQQWNDDYGSQLENIRKIGEGGEGSAHLMRRTTTNQLVVVKIAHRYERWGHLPREVRVLREILGQHPRIINLLHYDLTIDGRYIGIYEYYAGGDLMGMIKDRKYSRESRIWHVFLQVAEALAFLHHGHTEVGALEKEGWRHIVHCDLKPENIFLKTARVSEYPLPELVLGDFGFANPHRTGMSQEGGTLNYMPPEFPTNSAAGDIWALGSIIHEMVHGCTPLDRMPRDYPGSQQRWVTDPRARNPRPFPPSIYPDRTLDGYMMQCLRRDARNRPKSIQIVESLRLDYPSPGR